MTYGEVWLVVGLFSASIPLVALAKRVDIPYPVVLVLGGLGLGFIPGLPQIKLDPNLVLVLFLPPLLYWEAITAPTDVMRANAGQIWTLAIGLVIATTVVVAVVAHAAITNLAWPMAFVLGAIVAPTDELASVPVLERLKMPRHVVAVVEGESLLNDASSLILYAVAVTAAVSGEVFHVGGAVLRFALSTFGGLALGLLVGRLAIEGWRRFRDTQIQGIISLNLPYLAYILADRFTISGVLAVVSAGVFVNRFTPMILTAPARLQLSGFWETLVFLANALLFLLVGLQLHDLARAVLTEYSWQTVLWYAVVVNVTVVGTRLVWFMVQEYMPVIGGASEHPDGDWKHALISAWSGLRGAVSLAAALAIPVTIASGAPLAHRNLVIFLTFTVILVTLVGGGLTLPALVRALEPSSEDAEGEEDIRRGLVAMSEAALATLSELEKRGDLDTNEIAMLRRRYKHRRAHADGHPEEERAGVEAEREILEAQRNALADLRDRREIDNTVLRKLVRTLDISEEEVSHRSSRTA
jgi:Na+/H+ antiporter